MPLADALVSRLKSRLTTLKVAPGEEPGAEMGPLVTDDHLKRVRGYIDLGVEEGASWSPTAGKRRSRRTGSSSAPTLFDHVTPVDAHL